MGYANYNPFKNAFSGAASYLKNIFKQPALTPAPTPQWNSPYVPQENIPASYQIKEGDTFASIGAQFQTDEAKLQDMNKMVVPPPKGSWITVRPQTGANSFTSGDQVSIGNTQLTKPTVQQLINQGVPPAVAAQMASGGTQGLSPAQQTGIGSNSFTSGANVNLGELTFNYQNQIANNIAPKSIPTQVLGSLGATPQSMAQAGYVLNSANGMWELGGTGGANNNNDKPDPYSEVKSVYYSRSRGYVTPEVAALLNKKKRRRADAPKQNPVTFATNAGGLPVNTLDVRVGSG